MVFIIVHRPKNACFWADDFFFLLLKDGFLFFVSVLLFLLPGGALFLDAPKAGARL